MGFIVFYNYIIGAPAWLAAEKREELGLLSFAFDVLSPGSVRDAELVVARALFPPGQLFGDQVLRRLGRFER